MSTDVRFKSVKFRNYKALKDFSISFRQFNVLVGPNNSGKSTILDAFRILSEGLRKANSRKTEIFTFNGEMGRGYRIELDNLPVSTENVFTDYDDSEPATITFQLSNGNDLQLIFPERGICYLKSWPKNNRPIQTPGVFRTAYPISVGFVPVLGPVDHKERLFQEDAARRALLRRGASRNFRNIWYHYGNDFEKFRELIQTTWPGMDIERPEFYTEGKHQYLRMFCPERRYAREIYWAGFGFQIWCQLLTYALNAEQKSLFIIDEPDIYLHADLQRQFLSFLEKLGPDILIATHSTEIISEVEPADLLLVNKNRHSAKRLTDSTQLLDIFHGLGSNLNPTLTQLAKTRRALFVEGKDFDILRIFARKLGKSKVANRVDFSIISVEGFNPDKIDEYSKGIELALGSSILKSVIFDRDYRSEQEISSIKSRLEKKCQFAHIHKKKELENYLLNPKTLSRCIRSKIKERNERCGENQEFNEEITNLLGDLTGELKHEILGQYFENRKQFEKQKNRGLDDATISAKLSAEFDQKWANLNTRLDLISGKRILAELNTFLQKKYKVSVTHRFIAGKFLKSEISDEIVALISQIDSFRSDKVN